MNNQKYIKAATVAIEPAVVNLRDAATFLGVSPVTIRRAVTRGLLNPVRAFRHLGFPVADLQRFIKENSAGGRE